MPRSLERVVSRRLAIWVALLAGLTGVFGYIGADARWLAALGSHIVHGAPVASGVPFIATASAHWANPLALGELMFHLLESAFGDRGLAIAQLVCVAAALWVLAADARSGGGDPRAIGGALGLTVLGAFPSLTIARVQMFSLVLFPLLIALLRAEARRPSRRIWLAVPLLALWANLHGAVLLGLVTLLAYLLIGRLRSDPLTAVAAAVAGTLALCLTPAGLRTFSYLYGLSTNLAAQRGAGQWAPLGHDPFDYVAVLAVIALAAKFARRRPPAWEPCLMIVLAVLTIKAGRDAIWLLFLMVGPAGHRRLVSRELTGLLPVGAVVGVVIVVAALLHAPGRVGASHPLVLRALALAHGQPILADPIPAEQVAMAGGRIWAGNPIDAMPRRAQAAYLDWVAGDRGGQRELTRGQIRVVLVLHGGGGERLVQQDPRFHRVAGDSLSDLYVRS